MDRDLESLVACAVWSRRSGPAVPPEPCQIQNNGSNSKFRPTLRLHILIHSCSVSKFRPRSRGAPPMSKFRVSFGPGGAPLCQILQKKVSHLSTDVARQNLAGPRSGPFSLRCQILQKQGRHPCQKFGRPCGSVQTLGPVKFCPPVSKCRISAGPY